MAIRPLWPHSAPACISITMDNLAEAADLHRGIHPPSTPLGQHPSLSCLPRLLSALAQRDLPATYFVEGWNNAHYPHILKQVIDKGHEVGFHAWQHEVWKNLDAETELGNLDRSVKDLEKEVGIGYKGFRPPGGGVTERTLGLLKERGFSYISPAAERCAVVDGVAVVPFQWRDIDAYFYMESTKALRVGRGEGESPITPEEMGRRLKGRIDEVIRDGGYLALLFHPFLTIDKDRLRVAEEVLDYVKKKEQAGVWVARCRDVAEWVLGHEEEFGADPGWDNAEWKKK
ncbi:glycoside hydrolase/deacetylase [Myriangium duriaei CBS 260.36]|uniref:chitin deacetylase n=1 Tax=Myriangium duriaei CBS 260.36 TaxID=1168546 RepID=A0A9P4MFQ9_9PEZI|nr:glycoside hydrolase/deacetylase [Myriangium duriaei CBS 260.36]